MKNSNYAFGLAIVIAIFFESCNSTRGLENRMSLPAQVVVYQVTSGGGTFYDEYPASVVALNQVDIRPEVSGYVTGMYFKDGQHVNQGAKLYEIDQQQYKAAYDQALANVNVAKANLAKAQEDANRYDDLAKQDAVAGQLVDHAKADLRSAEMQVAAAEANVESVQTNFRNSIIYAPFDCTIGISLVKLGSAVTTGQTLLNTISSDNPMAVDCSVDEKQIGRFVQLLQKNPKDQDSIFTMVLPDESIYPSPGRLILMDRAVDPQTGTIRIRVIFPNADNLLKPGLTCNLRIKSNSSRNSLLIPYKAVVEQMGEYFIYLVKGNTVTQRRVNLGMTINDMVVVKDGVQSGDQIVTEGVQKIHDNSTIAAITLGANSGAPVAQAR
jgi:membrane fusion protein (multidrug efflux system)